MIMVASVAGGVILLAFCGVVIYCLLPKRTHFENCMAHFEKWDRGFGIPRQVRECMSALVMRVLPLVLLIMQPCSLSTLATLSNSPEGRSTRVLARSCACSLRCRGGQDKNAGAGGGAARQEVNGKEGMGRALLERYLTDAAEAERNSESFLGSSMYSW